jgi:hypothetical protein
VGFEEIVAGAKLRGVAGPTLAKNWPRPRGHLTVASASISA